MVFTPVRPVLSMFSMITNDRCIAVLSATYYEATDLYPPAPRADHIIPLSTMRNDTGNDASVPPGFSVSPSIPRRGARGTHFV